MWTQGWRVNTRWGFGCSHAKVREDIEALFSLCLVFGTWRISHLVWMIWYYIILYIHVCILYERNEKILYNAHGQKFVHLSWNWSLLDIPTPAPDLTDERSYRWMNMKSTQPRPAKSSAKPSQRSGALLQEQRRNKSRTMTLSRYNTVRAHRLMLT